MILWIILFFCIEVNYFSIISVKVFLVFEVFYDFEIFEELNLIDKVLI